MFCSQIYVNIFSSFQFFVPLVHTIFHRILFLVQFFKQASSSYNFHRILFRQILATCMQLRERDLSSIQERYYHSYLTRSATTPSLSNLINYLLNPEKSFSLKEYCPEPSGGNLPTRPLVAPPLLPYVIIKNILMEQTIYTRSSHKVGTYAAIKCQIKGLCLIYLDRVVKNILVF